VNYDINELKRALPLPELLAKLGLVEHAKPKAKCPWPQNHKHGDRNPSFSLTKTGKGWHWKCHAGCGHGDEIDFLAKWFAVSKGEAIRRYAEMAGITPKDEGRGMRDEGRAGKPVVDMAGVWRKCVEALTDEDVAKLAKWRGCSVEFCRWLRERRLLGLYEGRIALPIHGPDGAVAGIHYRIKADGSWRVFPVGTPMRPLVIGDTATADMVLAFESQWDALAVAALLPDWTNGLTPPVIATRGAANGKLVAGLIKPGAVVLAFRQNDDAAAKWLVDVAQHAGGEVRLVLTPEPHKDPNDWTKAGATLAELSAAMDAAKPVVIEAGDGEEQGNMPLPGEDTTASGTLAALAEVTGETAATPERRRGPEWPQLQDATLYGLAGDIVRAIDPHTEADPVAVLVQFLTAFGNIIGRSAFYSVEATRHGCNLSACLVGKSSKARKGTSWGQVLRLFAGDEADDWQTGQHWARERTVSGLSTGEGVIWAVRDPIIKCEAKRDDKKRIVKDAEGRVIRDEVEVDPGVTDKRLLVQEGEFAQLLKALEREGNTLSPVLRNAWDGAPLRILTKNAPAFATGAHISIVGHITREELLSRLTATEMANGFANRFLWLCVNRSKILPDGGGKVELADPARRLRGAVEFALKTTQMRRDDEARSLWHREYERLSEGRPGLAGAICGRAEAQVLRLSCLYALLDCTDTIHEPHLTAALALWDYAAASVRYIWGDALGNPVADAIRQALATSGPSGLSRTELHNLVGNNRRADEIDRALALLAEYSLARVEHRKTSGRPLEIWTATGGRP
jgi:hypothetical protein